MARPVSQGGIDYPDGGFSGGSGGYPMTGDLAELAARLGSIDTYDRRGNVVWMTDFEYGLQGSTFGTDHTDSTGTVVSSRTNRGAYCIKMDPRGVADSYVTWGRIVQFLESGPVGVEYSLSIDSAPQYVRLTLRYNDRTNALTGLVQYDPSVGSWRIFTGVEGWVTVLEDFELQAGAGAWHVVKLVIDPSEEEYVRLLVGKEATDLDGYTLVKTADTAAGQLNVAIKTYGAAATHAPVYVDSIIVTQNE